VPLAEAQTALGFIGKQKIRSVERRHMSR